MKVLLTFLGCIFLTSPIHAGDHSFKIGPAAIGSGGTNPVTLPPVDPMDWEYTYVSKDKFETNISIFPGIVFGPRFSKKGLYISGGGGLLLSANGVGPGIYNSFGYITGDAAPGWHLNFEYKQSFGYSSGNKQIITPSALRIGVIWK